MKREAVVRANEGSNYQYLSLNTLKKIIQKLSTHSRKIYLGYLIAKSRVKKCMSRVNLSPFRTLLCRFSRTLLCRFSRTLLCRFSQNVDSFLSILMILKFFKHGFEEIVLYAWSTKCSQQTTRALFKT